MSNIPEIDNELFGTDNGSDNPVYTAGTGYGFPVPKVYSFNELQAMDLPPIKWILYPFIPEKGVCMIAAPRGVGKSFFAMTMALVVSSGASFLGFRADKAYRVLYVDGEMNGRTLQDRFKLLSAGLEQDGVSLKPENLHIYGCDFQENAAMPDLANPNHWPAIDMAIQQMNGVDLIILDNIFTLYNCPDENAASNWQAFNRWSIQQRVAGRSVLWIHHTGKDADKGGRGSSAIETLLDASMLLKRPQGYTATQGAVISVEYTKNRSRAGDDVAKFAIRLENIGAVLKWAPVQGEEELVLETLKELLNRGMSVAQIIKETGLSQTQVYRIFDNAGIKNPAKIAKAAQQRIAEENKKQIKIEME